MIKLHISNFWPSFDYTNNFFVELFKDIYTQDIIFTNINDCNLCLIADCNIPPELDKTKTKTICFTGEPKKIDFSLCDYYLTFDPDSDNNIRLPLWYIYINFYNLNNQKNPIPAVKPSEIDDNIWLNKLKNNFCIAPFSVATKARIEFYNLLNYYKPTYGFGLPFGNGDQDRNELKKYDVISNFKFCMTFENTCKQGYVTEKILQAKTAGCIPIYWGDEYVTKDFNPNSFIYVNKFKSFNECLEYVKYVDNNFEEYNKYCKEPLFLNDIETNLNIIKTKIKNKLADKIGK